MGHSWVLLLLVGLLLAVYFAADIRSLNAAAPSADGIDFAAFAAEMPPPDSLYLLEADHAVQVVWVGHMPNWAIRSGPPCYLFGSDGKLTQWCVQQGDCSAFDPLYRNVRFNGREVTLDEARAAFRPAG